MKGLFLGDCAEAEQCRRAHQRDRGAVHSQAGNAPNGDPGIGEQNDDEKERCQLQFVPNR